MIKVSALLAQGFRKREVAHVLDNFLAVVAADPVQVGTDLALVQRRVHIDVEVKFPMGQVFYTRFRFALSQ